LAHDTRDSRSNPKSGGLRALRFDRYQYLTGNSFSFNKYSFDFRQYIPLWKAGWILGLRNAWVFEQEGRGANIPFYRLAALDAYHMLRGFKRGRFRDRSSVVFNIENVFLLSKVLEVLFFYDTGRVFSGPTDFSFSKFKYSFGGGLNLNLFDIRLFRFRAAYGGEGVRFIFSVTQDL
jgi:hypothetical protein